jgi:hypothetical protein
MVILIQAVYECTTTVMLEDWTLAKMVMESSSFFIKCNEFID